MREQIKIAVLTLILAYIYYPTFVWMADRWFAEDSYYGHGILIPGVALYWLWTKRQKLAEIKPETCWLGLIPLLFAAFLQLGGSILRIYFISASSFVFLLLGLALFIYGKEIFKHVWYPLAFLFVMVPLPLLTISEITLRMKFFISDLAAWCLSITGIEAYRNGSYLVMPNSVLLVGDPCSGLRSFIAFLCLGLVFAYGDKLNLWKRGVLVAMGFPLAIISNLFRVYCLGIVAEIYGSEAAGGKVHDTLGVIAGIFALIIFFVVRQRLEGVSNDKQK